MKTTTFKTAFCASMILISVSGFSVGQEMPTEKILDSTRNSLTTQTLPFDVQHGIVDSATGNFFGYAEARVDAPNSSSSDFVRAVVASTQGRFKPVEAWLAFAPTKMVLSGDRLVLFNFSSFKVYDATTFKPLAGSSVARPPDAISFHSNVMKIGSLQFDLDRLSSSVSSTRPLVFKEGTLRDGLLYRDAKPVLNLGNVTQSQAIKWGLTPAKAAIVDAHNDPFGMMDERGVSFGYKDIPLQSKGLFVRVYNANQIFVSIHAGRVRATSTTEAIPADMPAEMREQMSAGPPKYSDLKTALEKVILSAPRIKAGQDFITAFQSAPICAANDESIYIVAGNLMLNWSAQKLIDKHKREGRSKPKFKKQQDSFVFTDPVHNLTHEVVGGKAPFQFKLIGSDPFLKVDSATGVVSFAYEKYAQKIVQGGLRATELKASFIQDYQIRTAEEAKWAKETLGLQTKGMHRKIPISLQATDATGERAIIHYKVIACVDLEPHFPAIEKIKKRYTSAEKLEERLLKLEKQFEFISRD